MTTETQVAVQEPDQLDWDAVILELDEGMDRLPEQALRTCQRFPELATPRLIQVLEEAVRLGLEGTIHEGNAPFFALFLLTEFKAKSALPIILGAFSLRDPVLDGLFGSAITEVGKRTLAVLADDQPDLLQGLIANRELDDYIRWQAAAAFPCLVADGRLSRAAALERLVREFRTAVAARDYWGVTVTVDELGDLNPLEFQDEIKAAFDEKLVDESIIDWDFFEEHLLHPEAPEKCLRLDRERSAVMDTVAELQKWHCFSEAWRHERMDRSGANVPFASDNAADHFGDALAGDDWDEDGASLDDDLWNLPPPALPDSLTIRRDAPHVGRNDPCPCGSGKKYKKCCLRGAGDD